MDFSASFHFSEDDLISKFTMNQLHVDFIKKDYKIRHNMAQPKVGQILQTGTFI